MRRRKPNVITILRNGIEERYFEGINKFKKKSGGGIVNYILSHYDNVDVIYINNIKIWTRDEA